MLLNSRHLAAALALNAMARQSKFITEVEDSGIGFDPESARRIFDAFEQGDRVVRRQFGGLGLGLAISKRLVELHDGTITADSKGKNRGALFRITLPLAAPQLAAETYSSVQISAVQVQRLRILLVEDNRETAFIIQTALNGVGHEVATATDVTSALALASTKEFDLLISDLGLPDRSGVELLKDLRASGRNMQAIAISGFGRQEDVETSLNAGFAEHITKPFELVALEQAICRAI